jgi:hypothetical protein
MKYALIAIVLALLTVGTVAAQCQSGQSCSGVPWRLPFPPPLRTPTPAPTLSIITTGTPAAGTPTTVSPDMLIDQLSTLEAYTNATPMQVLNPQGTPVAVESQFDDLATPASNFFAYARGVGEVDMGEITPMIQFTFVVFGVVVATTIITFFAPILVAAWGFVKGFIQLILSFFT